MRSCMRISKSAVVVWCVALSACASKVDHIADSGNGSGSGSGGGSGAPLTGVAAISAGIDFACALMMDGTVRCWGEDDDGQLGGMVNDPSLRCGSTTCSGAVAVAGATGGLAIASGLAGSCLLQTPGTVECWGDNTNGQLGNGSTTSSDSPVPVTGLANATAISAGDQTMCALEAGGGVVCWGAGVLGQIGDDSIMNALTPTAPTGLASATAIAAGDGRSCAVIGGAVDCWGDNNLGELGVGTSGHFSDMPVAAVGVSGASAVSSFGFTTCALVGGTVTCWGDDSNGELGTGIVMSQPVVMAGSSVGGLSNVTAIATGQTNFACALTTGGAVDCWGANAEGELGNGTTSDSAIPVPVTGLTGVTAISAGGDFACALLSDHTVQCWGNNNDAQLGNGTTTESSTPTTVIIKS